MVAGCCRTFSSRWGYQKHLHKTHSEVDAVAVDHHILADDGPGASDCGLADPDDVDHFTRVDHEHDRDIDSNSA